VVGNFSGTNWGKCCFNVLLLVPANRTTSLMVSLPCLRVYSMMGTDKDLTTALLSSVKNASSSDPQGRQRFESGPNQGTARSRHGGSMKSMHRFNLLFWWFTDEEWVSTSG
jgi:hypothetical protein